MPRRSAEATAAHPRMTPRERQALVVYTAALGVAALAWFLGFSHRGSIWSVDMELVRRSGIFNIYGNNVTELVNTFLLLCVVSGGYLLCLWAVRCGFPRSFEAAVAGSVLLSLAVLPV